MHASVREAREYRARENARAKANRERARRPRQQIGDGRCKERRRGARATDSAVQMRAAARRVTALLMSAPLWLRANP